MLNANNPITKVKKAVFPVAGLGTRFLPATKANPKEMLPIVDKPLIQYAVEEAIEAGVTELIFVTSALKRAIEDHFDSHFELEHKLKSQNKLQLLADIQNIVPKGVSCVYIRQKEALGLGHAVLCAKELIKDEPFAVILADDLIHHSTSCLSQMTALYEQTKNNILAVEHILPQMSTSYGVVDISSEDATLLALKNHSAKILGIVEKPQPHLAPSSFGVVGRYILNSEIFEHLENTQPGSGGEIQLTDAIFSLMKTQETHAYAFEGKRYDCGSKIGYLQAVVDYGLRHKDTKEAFKNYLDSLHIQKQSKESCIA